MVIYSISFKPGFSLVVPLIMLFLSGCVSNMGLIIRNPEKIFEEVPLNRQVRLKERLQLFMEYHVNRDWDNVYVFFSQNYFSCIEETPREQFIKNYPIRYPSSDIVKFKVYSCQPLFLLTSEGSGYIEGTWYIKGCGVYKRGLSIESFETSIEASWENDDWYFSPPSVCFRSIDGPPMKCQY